MASFLAPSRSKLLWTFLGLMSLPGAFLLRAVPAQWDLLELGSLGDLILGVFLALPIQVFDTVTGSAFAPRTGGFLGFPSLAQVGFALCANVLFFYLLACGGSCWYRARTGRNRTRAQPPTPGCAPRD